MRQAINLLSQRPRQRGMLWWTVCGLAVAGAGVLGWAAYLQVHIAQLQASERSAQHTLAQLRQDTEAKKRALGLREAQNQTDELTRLHSQLMAQKDWADWLDKGDLGHTTGPAQVLEALASQHPQGLWLERVTWPKAGPSLQLSGSALTLQTVVDYAHQLDQQRLDKGAFTALETYEEMPTHPANGLPGAALIRFKLY